METTQIQLDFVEFLERLGDIPGVLTYTYQYGPVVKIEIGVKQSEWEQALNVLDFLWECCKDFLPASRYWHITPPTENESWNRVRALIFFPSH